MKPKEGFRSTVLLFVVFVFLYFSFLEGEWRVRRGNSQTIHTLSIAATWRLLEFIDLRVVCKACSACLLFGWSGTRYPESPSPHALTWYLSALRLWGGSRLSFSMTAARTYLPFYFWTWLTGWQPWHSCNHCGACYYAYINILINTWLAIEEIIACHQSTVRKERALVCARACLQFIL